MRVIITHHESRHTHLQDMLRALKVTPLIVQGYPSPLEAFKAAVRVSGGPFLLLQDDIIFGPDLVSAATKAASQAPEAVIAFFSLAEDVEDGLVPEDQLRFPAAYIPKQVVQEFLPWARVQKNMDHHDDKAVARFCTQRSIPVLRSCPSLVDHPDDLPSIANPHRPPRVRRSPTYRGPSEFPH